MARNSFNKKKGLKMLIGGVVIAGSMALAFVMSDTSASKVKASPNNVGELTVVSESDGHSFLLYKNTDNKNQRIAAYDIKPNDTVSIGTWGNKGTDGVYINMESYFATVVEDAYPNRVSLTTDITSNQLAEMDDEIISRSDWSITKNCTWFAMEVWNEMTPEDKHLYIDKKIPRPKHLSNEIIAKGEYDTLIDIPDKTEADVLMYDPNGSTTYKIRPKWYNKGYNWGYLTDDISMWFDFY